MNRVTINDVAKEAGVSKSTVSQFLNKRYEYMSEATRKRIEQTIKELDYTPNFIARSLTQKSTKTIGVIVANILHTFTTQVIKSIEDYCNTRDFHVIICNADDNPIKEKRYIDMLRAKQVDGIIAFPTSANVDLYKNLIDTQYPIVFMDRKVTGVSIDTVLLDNEVASSLAVQEFFENGYRRIGMVSPPIDKKITPRVERINGYKKALQYYGLEFNPDYLISAEIVDIPTKIKKMLTLSEKPDAILASNDLVILEVLKYVKENKVKVPNDLGIIGIDEVSFSSFYTPELTTITQPAFEMGKKAAELLLTKIKSENSINLTEKCYRFKPQMIKRLSAIKTEEN